ncbi:hypothetical protein ACQR35_13630 [Pseudarthrobacter sp. J1738]|uniref:hypothetical protein n=1 Tax=unclassified Pseudarthrobacter TaxID=2647000 RepID=UPI003D2D20E7
MRTSPRIINRMALGLTGMVLLSFSVVASLAATNPDVANIWSSTGEGLWAQLREQLNAAPITGPSPSVLPGSWWTAALIVVALVVALLLIRWIGRQGSGRVRNLGQQHTSPKHSEGLSGTTTIDTSFAAQAIKSSLSEHPAILNVNVSGWKFGKGSSLRIDVTPRKGTSPRDVSTAVEQQISGLDQLLGESFPVLIRLRRGLRSSVASSSRVN